MFALVDDQGFWFIAPDDCNLGPWLGGFQPPASSEPAGGWSWVNGEAFSYTAWGASEPNDFAEMENRVHFFDDGCTGGAIRSAQWNDASEPTALAYVLEWEHPLGLDVDGDGETDALTDGLLVLRYLFGFAGATLTDGAVDEVNCTRCDAAAIEAFLGTLD